MAKIIEMPKLSDTMEEGGIASWLKKVGDFVKEGELLVNIETDKATMEYASPEEGVLLEILVNPGTAVPLKAPIAILGAKGEVVDKSILIKKAAASSKSHAPAAVKTTPALEKKVESTQAVPQSNTRIFASPLAKKMAKEKGIELGSLSGSGPHGRIIASDLESTKVSSARAVASLSARKIPLTMMRKTIAKRLTSAKNDAPHFYLTISANMEKILKWRKDLNESIKDNAASKVSVNDILILAASRALLQHPSVNSSWADDAILQHGSVDVCFAVALPEGLITPVLRNTNLLGLKEIARASKDLGEKAKKGLLKPEDYAGGTFTISNLGMTKVEQFTAIINPPQACILAVGTVQKVPWVAANDQIIAQSRIKMTLSCDHRVVDGMVGAKFLETLVEYLENPLLMLN